MSSRIYHKGSGFYFDAKININDYNLDLISLGTRYKFALTVYGIGLYSDLKNI